MESSRTVVILRVPPHTIVSPGLSKDKISNGLLFWSDLHLTMAKTTTAQFVWSLYGTDQQIDVRATEPSALTQ